MKCNEIRCNLCKHHEVCKYREDVNRLYEYIRNIDIPVPDNITRFDICCKYFETVIYNTLTATRSNEGTGMDSRDFYYANNCKTTSNFCHSLDPIQHDIITSDNINLTSTDKIETKLDHDTDHETF